MSIYAFGTFFQKLWEAISNLRSRVFRWLAISHQLFKDIHDISCTYIPALKTHLLVAPENGWLAWLEDYIPFEARLIFRGYVSFREGIYIWVSHFQLPAGSTQTHLSVPRSRAQASRAPPLRIRMRRKNARSNFLFTKRQDLSPQKIGKPSKMALQLHLLTSAFQAVPNKP